MTEEQFKEGLLTRSDEEIVREVLLAPTTKHISEANVAFIAKRLAETYAADETSVTVYVVGSAKLGFSISEKRERDGTVLPRFRPFRASSDIDIAVISAPVFDAVWNELSRYASRSPRLPWQSGQLGHYLVHGWLRPDHFPRARLRRCDIWWDLFRQLSRDARFGRRAVRGGLFYSTEDLVLYQQRAVAECRRAVELE